MRVHYLKLAVFVLAALHLAWAQPALAAEPATEAEVDLMQVLKVQQLVTERFPNVQIVAVKPSPWPTLFEVWTPEEIVYTDAAVNWMILGQMLDAKSRENVTMKAWNDSRRIDYDALPFGRAIKIVKGTGERQLALFEDPLCPFCEEIERTLAGLDNITAYVFLYPLEDVHPGATALATKIWCAEDRASAWLNWMNKRIEPDSATCDDAPIGALAELGGRLNVNATPTLFFPDGFRIGGSINKVPFEKALAEHARAPATTDASQPAEGASVATSQ